MAWNGSTMEKIREEEDPKEYRRPLLLLHHHLHHKSVWITIYFSIVGTF
jgi:hypothetical protein